jgi:hypothetical protein
MQLEMTASAYYPNIIRQWFEQARIDLRRH